LIGQTIGNYLVTQKLGEGGMGAVYLGTHPQIGKKVAIKVLHQEFASNQDVTQRFFNEAKAVNDIGHPNIVDIVDFGIIQTGPSTSLVYFIMEYLPGQTLSQLLRAESSMPPERAFQIAMQVADALSASHKAGIVHRDLKPDNIILISRGRERDFVKLLDFGIAKLTGDGSMSQRTRTGLVMGTPAYMSPEQCEGRATVDYRTDIYALGIVLYEMLTGRVPFIGEGYGEILVQHLTQRPVPPSSYRMLPPHIELVVLKALEKRQEMRYPNMDEFIRAMADPVGYVEANGGVGGFLARQLLPSVAPLPAIRHTPAPMMMTPSPGTLSPVQFPTPAPGQVPTTLGGAAGQQVAGGKSKTPLFVAAGIVVVGAGIAIAVVASKGKGGGDEPAAPGSDTTVVAQPIPPTPPPKPPTVAPDAAVAAIVTPDAAVVATPDAPIALPPPVPKTVAISLESMPAGAEIFLDGVDMHKVTPATLDLPRKAGTHANIQLKLTKYADFKFPPIELAADASEKAPLRKVSGGAGSGAAPHVTTPPHTHPTGGDPDGLEKPE
jgi:serine/threonine-protein kinase